MKKKILWITGLLPIIETLAVIDFLPDTIPMHYNAAGEIDRYGSKYEMIFVSALLSSFVILWEILLNYYEKKIKQAKDEKTVAGLKSTVNAVVVIALATNIIETAINTVFICKSFSSSFQSVGIEPLLSTVVTSLMGILFVIIGNVFPKSRRNSVFGLRVKWSMYNDETWVKSHRFAGRILIIAGIIIFIFSILMRGNAAYIMMIIVISTALIVSLAYSRFIYKQCRLNENEQRRS